MKKCNYCMSDIDEKAKICPNCRKKLNKKINGKILLILLIVLVSLGGIMSLVFPQNYYTNDDFFSDLLNDTFTIYNENGSVSKNGLATISGKIKNNKNKIYTNIVITYSLYDKNRNKIGTASTTIQYINEKEELEFNATGTAQYKDNISFSLENITTK